MNLAVLGEKIKQRREARGFKQIDVANALQISPQAVSKWERGENAPDISLLPNLCKLLGVSVDWLLGSYDRDKDVFEATVFLSNVLGYARKAQILTLTGLADWANALLFLLTETVLRHDGVPVKNLGDGVLCFFSGNRHQERALSAAREVKRLTVEPLMIVLSAGPIYLGSLGHPDYAQLDIMGNAVNIAFLAIPWRTGEPTSITFATSTVIEAVEEPGEISEAKEVMLTGINQPVELFEVLG